MPPSAFQPCCSSRSPASTVAAGAVGYGKGHFDRSIAALSELHPVLAIGLAYSVQEIDAAPVEAHDRMLNIVVTEAEVIRPPATKP
jgi:5-formyltetrahydrofolate cyclo-ligase